MRPFKFHKLKRVPVILYEIFQLSIVSHQVYHNERRPLDLWCNFLQGQYVHKLCHSESRISKTICKNMFSIQVNASVFTLLAMTLERYRAIITPLAPRNSHTTLWIGIGLIWSCSAILALPSAFASTIFVQVTFF